MRMGDEPEPHFTLVDAKLQTVNYEIKSIITTSHRSNFILAIQGMSAAVAYQLFARGQWAWMAVALYVHGGLLAFDPYTHELSHSTMFKTRWLNTYMATWPDGTVCTKKSSKGTCEEK